MSSPQLDSTHAKDEGMSMQDSSTDPNGDVPAAHLPVPHETTDMFLGPMSMREFWDTHLDPRGDGTASLTRVAHMVDRDGAIYIRLPADSVLVAGGPARDVRPQGPLRLSQVGLPWMQRHERALKYVHYRVVRRNRTIALKHFGSTRQLVGAVRDALTAHADAFNKAKVLHGDVNPGTILMDQTTRKGVLIDWDLAYKRVA
ncbi:hypothetical protein BV25DRAFT_1914209 [Artomyces pyxidatus]|uniref:Uncharacterized protein n=1 Tax=Artomyces pyxidatus TaxID=48021 RepID=A0ACB8T6W0_9AGAM|nr:hypothetical protein BV25DRAFT_1914209 [Artomyces pyxidatus]